MKHIHIVDPYGSAAMNRMVQPFIEWFTTLYEVSQSEIIDEMADVNIHIPWHTMVGVEDKSKHIIAYTHCNAGAEPELMDACQRADIITCMTYQGRNELLDLGVDAEKIWVIYCASDQFKYRKRLIGIIGYPQPNGRKREGLLLDMAWQYDMSQYEFLLTGAGWEGMEQRMKMLGVSCSWHHADTFEKLNNVLRFLDVLVVTGYREGGPLPLLECMAVGVPVLSPRFGYAADLLDDSQIYKDTDDLMDKLDKMFSAGVNNHLLSRAWTWQDYAAEYALLIGRLLGESVELFPEQAAARYAQILDVISQIKPSVICEIGTWNGNRALQMIQQAGKYNEVEYYGFDLFESMTMQQYKKELSKFGQREEIVKKRLDATGAKVTLIKGDTKQTLSKAKKIFDFIFVDGGHSENTIENDGRWTINMLFSNTVAIFDDYYHEGKPNGMGCNKFIDGLDRSEFEITHLPVRSKTADGRVIGMVKVKRAIQVPVPQQTYTYAISYN